MAVNARTEEFQHIEVFDKPALFTNGRIARDTVPEGWYCYDIRGSDDDPGALCYMEENVVVNHAGSVLMPEKLVMPKSGRLDVRDELGFLDEGNMTLREFCEAHQLSYPTENMKFHIRPARPEEAGLFYTPHPEEDKRLGTVGHVRMDFGRSGNEFWHTWWPRGPEELNSPVFKAELQEVVDTLRESVLKNRFAMERFCYARGGKISGGWTQNYGYIVETEHYRYCLRCNPSPGDYNGYLTAYDLDVQRLVPRHVLPLDIQIIGRTVAVIIARRRITAQAVAVALRFHDLAVVLYIAAVDFPAVVIAETLHGEAIFQHTLPQRVHDLLQFQFERGAVQLLRAAGPPGMPELVATAPEVHADMTNGTQPLIFFGVRGIK